jgi:hypothetical protein
MKLGTLEGGFHDPAEIAFSGHQDAENELTRSDVPLKREFRYSAGITLSGSLSVENELTRN